MLTVIKSVGVAALVITLCLPTEAQSSRTNRPLSPVDFEPPPVELPAGPCPDARLMPDAYSTVAGEVLGVIDGETIVIRVKGKRKLIHLVGVDAPGIAESGGVDARRHLESLISGGGVEVWYKGHLGPWGREITGIVKSLGADMRDLNLEQIRAGMAKYKDFGANTQSSRDRCLYQWAEEVAKEARRGVWHGAP